MSQDAGQERRRFFRIDDEVAISYRVISNDEMTKADGLKRNEVEPASLANELEKMNEISRIHFRHVEKESPEVARYFSFIESKIDLLAHHIIMGTDELFVKTIQPVNISASGVSFSVNNALNAGDTVEIKFILTPSLTSIKTLSRVISCEPEGDQFKVAVEYSQLSDEDRDLLIRHIVKKQMNDMREQSD